MTVRKLIVLIDNVQGELPLGDSVDLSSSITWTKGKVTIPAGASVVIDTLPKDTTTFAKYICSIYNKNSIKASSLEYSVNYDGVALESTVSNKLGSKQNFLLEENIVLTNIEITVTNSEIYNMEVEYAKMVLGQ